MDNKFTNLNDKKLKEVYFISRLCHLEAEWKSTMTYLNSENFYRICFHISSSELHFALGSHRNPEIYSFITIGFYDLYYYI